MFKMLDRVKVQDGASRFDGCFGFITNVFVEDGQFIDATVNVETEDGRVAVRCYGPDSMTKVEELSDAEKQRSAESEDRVAYIRRPQARRPVQTATGRAAAAPQTYTYNNPRISDMLRRAELEQQSVEYWGWEVNISRTPTDTPVLTQPSPARNPMPTPITAEAFMAWLDEYAPATETIASPPVQES